MTESDSKPESAETPDTSEAQGDVGVESSLEDASNGEIKVKQSSTGPIVSSSKKLRPPYKYDPNKITLRFIFANRDGLTVTVECTPTDTVGEVKGALMSVWPEDLPDCSGGDRVRLICMGKGILMPDSRTLQDCEVPVFKTHPTPINVAIRPEAANSSGAKGSESPSKKRSPAGTAGSVVNQSSQGCGCIMM